MSWAFQEFKGKITFSAFDRYSKHEIGQGNGSQRGGETNLTRYVAEANINTAFGITAVR